MSRYLVTRGTTLHGKALNEGDVVELDDYTAGKLRSNLQRAQPAPAPANEEVQTSKKSK